MACCGVFGAICARRGKVLARTVVVGADRASDDQPSRAPFALWAVDARGRVTLPDARLLSEASTSWVWAARAHLRAHDSTPHETSQDPNLSAE